MLVAPLLTSDIPRRTSLRALSNIATCLRVHSAAAINHWATHYIIYKMWISAGLLALSKDHGENILNPCHEVKRQKQRCSHINWVAATPPPDCVSEVFNKHVLQTLRKSQSQIYTNK